MTVRKDSKPQREEPQNNLVYSVVFLFYGIGKCWFCPFGGRFLGQCGVTVSMDVHWQCSGDDCAAEQKMLYYL